MLSYIPHKYFKKTFSKYIFVYRKIMLTWNSGWTHIRNLNVKAGESQDKDVVTIPQISNKTQYLKTESLVKRSTEDDVLLGCHFGSLLLTYLTSKCIKIFLLLLLFPRRKCILLKLTQCFQDPEADTCWPKDIFLMVPKVRIKPSSPRGRQWTSYWILPFLPSSIYSCNRDSHSCFGQFGAKIHGNKQELPEVTFTVCLCYTVNLCAEPHEQALNSLALTTEAISLWDPINVSLPLAYHPSSGIWVNACVQQDLTNFIWSRQRS